MSRLFRVALVVSLLAGLLSALPAGAQERSAPRGQARGHAKALALAAPVTSVHYVPTVGDAVIRVEVTRQAELDGNGQGVLLTYSPYNTLGDPTGTGTVSGASPYLSMGIARAHADVLGTRGSTGCWDYGGAAEQQSGVDVVRFLAGEIPDRDGTFLGWSNGNVGMTGGSYNGTTATMVAATGLPALKAIEPIAAISHWYGYAYYDGMRYFLNSEAPTDEGFDTPLAFDHGIGDTFHTDNPDSVTARAAECGAIEHESQAYSRNPDYTGFWKERDYTLAPEKWTAATLIRHGWNDYNVKQDEAIRLFDALEPVADDPATPDAEGPQLLLRMTQGTHSTGTTPDHADLIKAFWRAHLLDDANAKAFLDRQPRVLSMGTKPGGGARISTGNTWPLEGTETHSFFLNRTYEQDIPGVTVPGPGTGEVGELSYDNRFDGKLPGGRGGFYGPTSGWMDTGLATEEISRNDPWSNDGKPGEGFGGQGYYSLAFSTPALLEDAHVAGSAVLEGRFNFLPVPGAALTPILVDIDANNNYRTIQRGFLNLDYRNGRGTKAPTPSGWIDASVTFLPEDYTVPKGHRIGLILQSSNTVWAVPGNPAGFVSVGLGGKDDPGTRLHLPLVTPSERIHNGFGDRPA
jgi:predicted acyl esterase